MREAFDMISSDFYLLSNTCCIPTGRMIKSMSISSSSPFLLHDFGLGFDLKELGNVEDCREDDHGDDVVHHPPPRVVALCHVSDGIQSFYGNFLSKWCKV